MLGKFLVIAVVILLFSSSAIADIGQVEGFSIGARNLVRRCGPIGSAQGVNMVIVGHSQKIHKPCFFTTATQEEKGALVQRGSAKGAGRVSGLTQRATVQGGQRQHIEPFGQAVQKQRLNMSLGQVAMKAGGVGSTESVQRFVGRQSQTINTPRMSSSESQFARVGQYSAVSGSKGSKGIVVNSVDVKTGQGQIVDAGRYFPR